MRTALLLLITFVGLLSSECALSQEWARESDTMFGIKLGVPVAEGAVPPCAPTTRAYEIPKGPCYESSGPYSDRLVRLWGLEALNQIPSSAHAYFHDGVVESIGVSLKHSHYQTFKAMLQERYGPPTKINQSEVTTGAGAKIPIETLEWSGNRTVLVLVERSGKVDEAQMLLSSRAVRDAKKKAEEAKLRGNASKL
jgi:hypothetical protein